MPYPCRRLERLVETRVMKRAAAAVVAIVAFAIATGSSGAVGSAKPNLVRFPLPAAGNFTVAVLELTLPKGVKGTPHPTLVTTRIPKDVDVFSGVTRDPKRARSFVEAIVILRHAASKRAVSAMAAATDDFIVFNTGVPFGGGSPPLGCSEASNALTIPRFADCSSARNIFVVNVCRTNLLFPFVTDQQGFDTGISIDKASVAAFDVACLGKKSSAYQDLQDLLGLSPPPSPPPPTPPSAACTTLFVNQGTLNEVIGTTQCQGVTFTGLLFTPIGGNRVVDQFPEQGQATCTLMQNGSAYCLFPSPVSSSGRIDLRFQNTPNGVQLQRSTNGGQSYETDSWNSTGP